MIVHNIKEGETKEDLELLESLKEILSLQDELERSKSLVKIVTEDYKAWNYLKDNLSNDQLYLTEAAIESNPKSYQAWYHRLYIFRLDPVLLLENIEREKRLLKLLLDFDSRNFHCWNYKHLLLDILRFLINVEGEVSEDDLKKLKYSGTKVYPSRRNERVVPHEETIKIIYDHMIELSAIGKDVSNYSYLHFYGDFDACAAIFTDPYDEGFWFYYQKVCENYLMRDGFYVRKYCNRLEIHFKEAYSGPLNIQLSNNVFTHKLKLPTRIFKMPLEAVYASLKCIKVNERVLYCPSDVTKVSLTKMHSFSSYLKESVFLTDSLYNEIVQLEPNCHFNLLFNCNKLKSPKTAIERLKELDPLRISYYNAIEEDLYSVYV